MEAFLQNVKKAHPNEYPAQSEYPAGFFDDFLPSFNVSDDIITRPKRKRPGVSDPQGVSSVQSHDPESSSRNKTGVALSKALKFCERIMKQTSAQTYLGFLKYLHDCGTEYLTLDDLIAGDFREVLNSYEIYITPSSEFEDAMMIRNKRKKPNKGFKDGSVNKQLTPSYYLLPKNVSTDDEQRQSRGDADQVLNKTCYSKGSFKCTGGGSVRAKINPDEEKLNQREDDLYQSDMLKSWMRSTKKNATNLLEAINKKEIERSICEEDVKRYLTSYNFRVIERMYDEYGAYMVDQVRQSPEIVLPVILNRLKTVFLQLQFV